MSLWIDDPTQAGPVACLPPAATDPVELLRAGRLSEARASLEEAASLLIGAPAAERAQRLVQLARACWASAEHAEALAHAEEALVLAREADDRVLEAAASTVLGSIHGAFGNTGDGVSWLRRTLDLVPAGAERARASCEMGLMLVRQGHLEAAMLRLREGIEEGRACDDGALAALARARLAHACAARGEMGSAERLLARAVAESVDAGDRLIELEVRGLQGALLVTLGVPEEADEILVPVLAECQAAGFLQQLPGLHAALVRCWLRRAVRLVGPTGPIVDRHDLEVARAHAEKGLDLTTLTGRMADRAALRMLSARCAEMAGETGPALGQVEQAHQLALETGDLLVASQARVVRAEVQLAQREFGVALAEARIACEAFDRSGAAEDSWRAHDLIARIHGAWGMATHRDRETAAARIVLRRIAGTLAGSRHARGFLEDVERAAAMDPPQAADAPRARRDGAPPLSGQRFTGRADTEDLVDALIKARHRIEHLERRTRAARPVLRDARFRREALLRASALPAAPAARLSERVGKVLDLAARACGGSRLVLVTRQGQRLRVRGIAGGRGLSDPSAQDRALQEARRTVDRVQEPDRAARRSDVDVAADAPHAAFALADDGVTFGALVARPREGSCLRRADVRLLRALAGLFALALAPSRSVTPAPADGD
jgi:tetratricopeptide (TPR) repeat protein